MAYFTWSPNFFIILVAPPGIISKSTTASVAMNLLREVPAAKFGPDVCTWQSLVLSLAQAQEPVIIPGSESFVTAEVTIESGELGNLINPHDREMVDLLVTLWDGRKNFAKTTKMNGSETIENPWINIIACTTPAWIAGNFPDYMIGGGFTSRCLFVYGQEKEKYVPYPALQVPPDMLSMRNKLVEDLGTISQLAGPYRLLPSAVEWGTVWYEAHYKAPPEGLADDRFGGYIARKQTHIHKLAMVLAASQREELIITAEDLAAANTMVSDLEADMPQVFARIGKTESSLQIDRLIDYVSRRGVVSYSEAFRFLQSHFPAEKDMEGVLAGCFKAGMLDIDRTNPVAWLIKVKRENAKILAS